MLTHDSPIAASRRAVLSPPCRHEPGPLGPRESGWKRQAGMQATPLAAPEGQGAAVAIPEYDVLNRLADEGVRHPGTTGARREHARRGPHPGPVRGHSAALGWRGGPLRGRSGHTVRALALYPGDCTRDAGRAPSRAGARMGSTGGERDPPPAGRRRSARRRCSAPARSAQRAAPLRRRARLQRNTISRAVAPTFRRRAACSTLPWSIPSPTGPAASATGPRPR